MTEKSNKKLRPTSPHLDIYRWNILSFTSILHRFTGVVLYFSIVAICWYVVYYTYQINISAEESCDCPMKQIMDNLFIVAAIGIIFSLYYHFCNGIRHLFWDIGIGFTKETAKTNGFLVIALSIIFTALTVGTILYLKLL